MEYKKDAHGNIIKVNKPKRKKVVITPPKNPVNKPGPKTLEVKPAIKKVAAPPIDVSNKKRNSFIKYPNLGKIQPIYKDKVIYIIGGGPSLKNFDWTLLKDKVKIAINKAFLYVPDAEVIYWTDYRFYKWYEKEITEFKGSKVTNKNKPLKTDIINLRDTGRSGLDMDPSSLRHGNNSGFAAINLAVHYGAKKIVLLGYDMNSQANATHWHDGYTKISHNHKIYKKSMIPFFSTLVEPLREAGVSVWNANPNSALDTFPKCTLNEALNMK